MLKALAPDPTLRHQTFTLTIDPDGNAITVRVELRYMRYTNQWYLSLYNAADDTCYIRYIPLVASGSKLNDLLGQFGYLGIGSIACVPVKAESGSLPGPQENTLSDFDVLWGDCLFP